MKLKFYLRGLGVGLVVATIILTISNNIRNNNRTVSNVDDNKQTQGSIIAYTKADPENQSATESNSEKETESAREMESTANTETTKETESVKETQTSSESVTQPEKEPTKPSTGTVTVTLEGIKSEYMAADLLIEKGVITNRSAFAQYMYSKGYDKKIRAGTYELPVGDSPEIYEKIGQIITQGK